MDSCSISPAIRETHIRATVRYHFTPTRMAVIKKMDNSKCRWRFRGTGTFLRCGWERIRVQPLWKHSLAVPQKIRDRTSPVIQGLRAHLPVQETQGWPLVQEGSSRRGAPRPAQSNGRSHCNETPPPLEQSSADHHSQRSLHAAAKTQHSQKETKCSSQTEHTHQVTRYTRTLLGTHPGEADTHVPRGRLRGPAERPQSHRPEAEVTHVSTSGRTNEQNTHTQTALQM